MLANQKNHDEFLNTVIVPILRKKGCEIIKIGIETRYNQEERTRLQEHIDIATLLLRQYPDVLVMPEKGFSFLLCAKAHDSSKYPNIAIEMLPVWISKQLGIPVLYPYIDGELGQREVGFWSSWILDNPTQVTFYRTGKYESALEAAIIYLTGIMPESHIKERTGNELIQGASKDPFFVISQRYLGIFESWEKLVDEYLRIPK